MITTADSLLNKRTIATLPIDSINLTSGTQIRETISDSTVLRYAALMETEEGRSKFPPIIVYRDGSDTLWIADGHHRVLAALRCELTEIRAEIRNGSKADALWAAAEINSKNALQLEENDICKAVRMLREAWPDRSNTMIAEAIGCTEGTVRYHLKQVRNVTNLAVDSADKRVVGKDGKSYPAKRAGKTDISVDTNKVYERYVAEKKTSVIEPERSEFQEESKIAEYYPPLSQPIPERDSQFVQTVKLQNIPLNDPTRLIACLFDLFDVKYREKLLDALARKMFAKDGKESTYRIIAALHGECRSADPSSQSSPEVECCP